MHKIWSVLCCLGILTNGQQTGISISDPTPTHPRPGIDFLGPMWLSRTYKITCCRGGKPKADNEKLISNWTETVSDYAYDEKAPDGQDEHCRVFEGSFLLSATALFNYSFQGYGVQCKCSESQLPLDRHCRQLPPCRNNGYRSRSVGGQCACQEPFFGEFCEKTCDQGQILKGVDGRSYCSCLPFYQGEQCTDMVCLNGGEEINGRCQCPASYLGYHCEVDGNRTVHTGNRFQRFGDSSEVFSRDISGTIFSIVMVVVLIMAMYLLIKHRMRVQSQFTNTRRDELSRAAALYGIPHPTVPDTRIAPFIAAGIEGPPPYTMREGRRNLNDILPPLPSYEDATKDLPVRSAPAPSSSPRPCCSAETSQDDPSPPSLPEPIIARKILTRRSL